MGPALLGCDRFCSGQQCLVTARATEQLVLMNRPVMEGSRFRPQMNRGLSGCLLPPPPPGASSSSSSTCLHGLHGLTANTDLFVPLKKKYLNFGGWRGGVPSFLLIRFLKMAL